MDPDRGCGVVEPAAPGRSPPGHVVVQVSQRIFLVDGVNNQSAPVPFFPGLQLVFELSQRNAWTPPAKKGAQGWEKWEFVLVVFKPFVFCKG
jgi:hypothetical protein